MLFGKDEGFYRNWTISLSEYDYFWHSDYLWAEKKLFISLPKTLIRMSWLSAPSMLDAVHWYRPESDKASERILYNDPLVSREAPSLLQ